MLLRASARCGASRADPGADLPGFGGLPIGVRVSVIQSFQAPAQFLGWACTTL